MGVPQNMLVAIYIACPQQTLHIFVHSSTGLLALQSPLLLTCSLSHLGHHSYILITASAFEAD